MTSFLAGIKRILSSKGYKVQTFSDPRNAVTDLSSSCETELLILDLTMPDFDGVEVLTALANSDCRLPIVLISGWWPETLELCTILGLDLGLKIVGSIEKPFDPDRISEIFATHARRSADVPGYDDYGPTQL